MLVLLHVKECLPHSFLIPNYKKKVLFQSQLGPVSVEYTRFIFKLNGLAITRYIRPFTVQKKNCSIASHFHKILSTDENISHVNVLQLNAGLVFYIK